MTLAIDRLNSLDYTDLADWAYESHKDFYGVKGRHMQGWTKAQLVEWISDHFVFDHDEKIWRNAMPFIGEE